MQTICFAEQVCLLSIREVYCQRQFTRCSNVIQSISVNIIKCERDNNRTNFTIVNSDNRKLTVTNIYFREFIELEVFNIHNSSIVEFMCRVTGIMFDIANENSSFCRFNQVFIFIQTVFLILIILYRITIRIDNQFK